MGPTVFTKNRERLLVGEVAPGFFQQVVAQARVQGLISAEHLTFDGTLIEAWAGQKSFQRKGGERTPPPDDPGNPSVDFHGERRSNATHQSTTDPQARLYKKAAGQEARLCYLGHLLMENSNGLVMNTRLTEADGRAERRAALAMVEKIPGFKRVTLGADKGYDAKEFVRELRDHQVTPHVAQKPASAIDRRTSRHLGYLLKPVAVQASGRGLRLAQDRGRTAEDPPSRALPSWPDLYSCPCGLRLGADPEPDRRRHLRDRTAVSCQLF